MGAMYEGYVASFGRPISFGKPSDERVYELLMLGLEANRLTHSFMSPGKEACEIVNKVHEFVRDAGYGERRKYYCRLRGVYGFKHTGTVLLNERGRDCSLDDPREQRGGPVDRHKAYMR